MTLVILCPGQGGQHPRMFERVLGEAAAQPMLEQVQAMLGVPAQGLAAREDRFHNALAQPLVCAGALAHWQVLRQALPRPCVVAGYSAGELAAHAVAGSFSATQCLGLAVERAKVMDAASPGDAGLLAVLGLGRAAIDALCLQHGLSVAIINGPDHVVVGGRQADLSALQADATAAGARTVALPVSVPAHTPLLHAAAAQFAALLAQAPVQAPALTLLAGIDGRRVADRQAVIETLGAQIAQAVQWEDVIAQAVERGGRVFLELGPGSALARRVVDLQPRLQARSVDDFQTLQGVVDWVAAACARA